MRTEKNSVTSVIVLSLLKEKGFHLRISMVQHWVLILEEQFFIDVFLWVLFACLLFCFLCFVCDGGVVWFEFLLY